LANDAPPSSASGQPERQPTAPDVHAENAKRAARADERPAPPDEERVVLDDTRIRRALMRIAHEIVESNAEPSSLYLVAIPNGGVPLGRILIENLQSITDGEVPLGILDTTLYRDDLAIRGTRPRLRKTEMPSSVDERIVVLVEDVVSTGRTIRAAMDALMDFGRPRAVKVVALVDRGHRELPIKIDYVGKNIPTQPGEKVVFRFPEGPAPPDGSPGGAGDQDRGLEVIVKARATGDPEASADRDPRGGGE